MKKIFFTFMILGFLHANPIVIPQVTISELYFPDNNTWLLELDIFGEYPYQHGMFDSVLISSGSGISKIRPGVFKQDEFFFVINSDSLFHPITVNPERDCIKVITYESNSGFNEPLIDSLCFGNGFDSYFSNLSANYSISRFNYDIYVKDKSPTLGSANDTCGTCATLNGFMYDIENELIAKGNFILDSDLSFSQNGKFSTRVFSLHYGKFFITEVLTPNIYKPYKIDTLKIDIEPDSQYTHNIYLHTDYIVDIHDQNQITEQNLILTNYPNPFNSTTTFKLKLSSDFPNSSKKIYIYGISGQLIKTLDLDKHYSATWDGTNKQGILQSSGIYLYKLVIDRELYKTGSIVLLK